MGPLVWLGKGEPQREQGVLTGRKTPTRAALLCTQITETPRISFKCIFKYSSSDIVALGLGKRVCISKNFQKVLLLLFRGQTLGSEISKKGIVSIQENLRTFASRNCG